MPFDCQRDKNMAAKSTSLQLLELIGEFERSATEILRRDLSHLVVVRYSDLISPKIGWAVRSKEYPNLLRYDYRNKPPLTLLPTNLGFGRASQA